MSADSAQRPVSNRGREFLASLHSSCLSRINRTTVPILGIQDDKIVHDRTGILYRIGGHDFVLTAAHDMRQIVGLNIPLYLSANTPGIDLLPLAEARFFSTEEDCRDVAAIWIPPDLAQELGTHKEFLAHNQINLNPAKQRPLYVFFGFPMQWSGHVVSETTIISQALAFATFEHEGDRDSLAHYDPRVHMLLNFTREAIHFPTGRVDTLPKPKGISGCGIWQVADRSERGLIPRSAETVTLVGIQHTWFPEYSYVQATRVAYALDLILEYYPETKAPMSLIYPGPTYT